MPASGRSSATGQQAAAPPRPSSRGPRVTGRPRAGRSQPAGGLCREGGISPGPGGPRSRVGLGGCRPGRQGGEGSGFSPQDALQAPALLGDRGLRSSLQQTLGNGRSESSALSQERHRWAPVCRPQSVRAAWNQDPLPGSFQTTAGASKTRAPVMVLVMPGVLPERGFIL